MGCCASTLARPSSNTVFAGRESARQDIRDRYRIGALLGSGAFGQVRECTCRNTGERYAVKIMERRSREIGHWSNENMFKREVNLMVVLKNEHIVRHVDFYEDRHFLYAVMERCDGGELFEQIIKLKRFSEEDAAILCRQMLQALAYLHSIGVVHRDIKAENFLFKEKSVNSQLKLIDFGMSAVLKDKTARLVEVCGSPHYLSPELIRRNYGTKVDMWALGVLIYLMLYGRYPFDAPATEAITQQVLDKPIDYSHDIVKPSEEAANFMRRLLERDADKRYSAEEALQDKWIEQAGRRQEEANNLIECVRSAHRKLTLKRKSHVSRKDEARRNHLLQQLEWEWASGKTGCVRLSPLNQLPNVKPEFSRHDKRMKTTPSRYHGGSLADIQALRRALVESGNATEETVATLLQAFDRSNPRCFDTQSNDPFLATALAQMHSEEFSDVNGVGGLMAAAAAAGLELPEGAPFLDSCTCRSASGGALTASSDPRSQSPTRTGEESFNCSGEQKILGSPATTIATTAGGLVNTQQSSPSSASGGCPSTTDEGLSFQRQHRESILSVAEAAALNAMMSSKVLHDSLGNFDWEAAEKGMAIDEGDDEVMYQRNERRAYTVSVSQKDSGLTRKRLQALVDTDDAPVLFTDNSPPPPAMV